MSSCPACNTGVLRRTQRTLGERLRGRAAAYECSHCGQRRLLHPAKHCWRCGTDLDRRRRQTVPDRLAAVLRLWPYSCRRCGKRRYRWGMRAA